MSREGYDARVEGVLGVGGVGKSMRYVAMQVVTWGTIAGAVGSALLLAALESPPLRYPLELPSVSWLGEPTQAGRARPKSAPAAPPRAASSPALAAR